MKINKWTVYCGLMVILNCASAFLVVKQGDLIRRQQNNIYDLKQQLSISDFILTEEKKNNTSLSKQIVAAHLGKLASDPFTYNCTITK